MEELFYNTKKGYMSKIKFIEAAALLNISKEDAEDFYNNQSVNQIYKKQNQKKKFKHIEAPFHAPGCFQIDLMIMTKFPKNQNKGNQYLLNILDVYSRYVKSFPIKHKSDKDTFPHIKNHIDNFKKEYPDNIISVTLDAGNEFKGLVKKYFDENDIKIFISTPNDNTKLWNMLVERYHRTFWEKLRKVLTHNESLKWFDYYEDITNNYNNTIHSKTKKTPYSIFINKEIRDPETENINPIKSSDELNEGETIRILKNKKQFTKKSFTPNWSISTYLIYKKEGNRYHLKYLNGNIKKGTYLARELQKVNNENSHEKYQKQTNENNKLNKVIRKKRKENIHNVDDDGNFNINKRLIPINKTRRKINI